MRAVEQLGFLAAEHRVTLLCPEPGPGDPPPPPELASTTHYYRAAGGVARVASLAAASWRGLPLQSALFHHPDLGRRIRRHAPEVGLVVWQMVRLNAHLPDLDAVAPQVPLVVDLIDCLSLYFQRRAEVDRPWLRGILRREARRLAVAEARLMDRARRGLLVCERDREHLASRLEPEPASRLRVAPLRLDPPASGKERPTRPSSPLLVFTGNLGYFVNVDGVLWWLESVWPAVRARHPDLGLLFAGARPDRRLRRAAARAGAELVDTPPDLTRELARGTLSLAPMRCGAGSPIKVLEAWATGVPVVASPWAAAGTTGRAGEDLAVAESVEQWVEEISALLSDAERRAALARSGRQTLERDYSAAAAGRAFMAAIEEATSP